MSSIARRWIGIGAILGAIGVALGAYGAHGLHHLLAEHGFAGDDLTRRLNNFETAIHYQMLHAIALVLTGLALEHRPNTAWRLAAWAFLVGIVLFSGLLKVLTFTVPSWNWLGAIVPVGGVSMIAGWVALAVGALRKS
jgi:uncharacterized membrane protein YgdD (TMEM256/DUF423 family)